MKYLFQLLYVYILLTCYILYHKKTCFSETQCILKQEHRLQNE